MLRDLILVYNGFAEIAGLLVKLVHRSIVELDTMGKGSIGRFAKSRAGADGERLKA